MIRTIGGQGKKSVKNHLLSKAEAEVLLLTGSSRLKHYNQNRLMKSNSLMGNKKLVNAHRKSVLKKLERLTGKFSRLVKKKVYNKRQNEQ